MTNLNQIKQKHSNTRNSTEQNIWNMMDEWLELNPRPNYEDSTANAVSLAMWILRKAEACAIFNDESWLINTTAHKWNIEQAIINREKDKSEHHSAIEYVENLLWNLK